MAGPAAAASELLDQPRPLYALLRDQHVIAGIGRSWVDEILHAAMLSPFKRGSDLDADEAERLRDGDRPRLGEAIEHYEQTLALPIPDKLPMPLTGPPPQRRAVPALRRPARGGVLRGLRDVLLPDVPDRGQAAEGPAAVAAAEVSRIRPRWHRNVGDSAPDFTLPDQHGEPVSLSGLRGKTVVLYFYPKADTPGCTTQACGVRDHRADYEQAGAVVLGVSPDPVKPIAKFDEKYGLGFPLLSDEDHAVAEAYGVWVEKTYGRTYMGNERTTFVIGPDGKIREVFRSVKPAEHDELVLGRALLSRALGAATAGPRAPRARA